MAKPIGRLTGLVWVPFSLPTVHDSWKIRYKKVLDRIGTCLIKATKDQLRLCLRVRITDVTSAGSADSFLADTVTIAKGENQ